MHVDDDLSAALPQAPPPNPVRRDAAIAVAMRRFDGEDAAPAPGRTERAGTPWWSGIARPQVAALAAVTIVALVGLPVLMSGSPRLGDAPRRSATEASSPISTASSVADRPLPPPRAVAPSTPEPPIVADSAPPPVVKPQARAESVAGYAAPPPPAAIAQAAAPPPPPAPVVMAEPARAPALAAKSAADADVMVTGSRIADARNAEIVVTAQRRRAAGPAERGDWNACTIDDPRRSLDTCKRVIAGAGVARSDVSDGLQSAWSGDTDAAIGAFSRAITASPRLAIAYLNRGLAYERDSDLDRALADLNLAVRYAPNAARGYYLRSVLLRRRGDTRRAEVDENRAIDLDPDYAAIIE